MNDMITSWEMTAKACRVETGSYRTKLVLILLTTFYNRLSGDAWPSIRKIAEEAEMSPRSVQRSLRELEQKGLVVACDGGGGRMPRRYRFCLDGKADSALPAHTVGVSASHPSGVSQSPQRCQPDTLTKDLTKNETNPPYPPGGELGLRIRLCSLFGHRDARLKDQKLNRSWSMAWATGQLDDEAVGLVEWWYGFRAKPAAAQPKPYWCRSRLPTLLNNWIDDVEFIRMKKKPEEDNRPAWEKGELIKLSN